MATVLLFAAVALRALAQEEPAEEDVLWMPEGYQLLPPEERSALPPDEMNAIGTRNQQLLREAVKAMTPEERQEVGARLSGYGQAHADLPQYVRQYITMASMQLLFAGMQEKVQADRDAAQARFEKLLHDQETTTKGFPSEREPVEKEANAIDAQLGKADARSLYLRVLKPLRARPWNDAVRVTFRRIVRGDSYARQQKTTLYDAALAFLQARQKDAPDEGAWFSLEAILRLSMRSEVAEAKRLFAASVDKNSRDVDSRLYPILLAELDGDQKEVERLMPRAQEAWKTRDDLDQALWNSVDALPGDLRVRARVAFGNKYKKAHPADWSSRASVLAASLEKGGFREVEAETQTLLALPVSTLPEPHRSEFAALRLQAIAGSGRCDEVVAAMPRFEAAVRDGVHETWEESAPPAPRTLGDARRLRAALNDGRRDLARLEAAIADGSIERAPEWGDEPLEKRREDAAQLKEGLEAELREMEKLLAAGDDAAVAAAWTRREHADWQAAIPGNWYFDLADRATRLIIRVRGAAGKCLLAHHRAADAAAILAPCAGEDQNYHGDCGEPLLEAGRELVREGRYREAGAVYAATAPVQNFSTPADDLYREIEKAAPGTVRKFQPTPTRTPRATATPGPTPPSPPA